MDGLDFLQQNSLYLTHGIHPYPAKFPPQLVHWALTNYSNQGDVVLDPMVGSGTTLVECAICERISIGIDIDPIAHLISTVKTTKIEDETLSAFEKDIFIKTTEIQLGRCKPKNIMLPKIDNLDKWFQPQVAVELAMLKEMISTYEDIRIRRLCMVALSSLILAKDSVSNAKDIVQTRPHIVNKEFVPDVLGRFKKRIMQTIKAVNQYSNEVNQDYVPKVLISDARSLPIENDSIDLTLFSPPYINALDYPRSHKFSIWWLDGLLLPGGISDYIDKQADYIGTEKVPMLECIGRIERTFKIQAIDSVIKEVAQISEKKAGVIHRYFNDMEIVFLECLRVIKNGKRLVLVVGDNVICGIQIETARFLISLIKKAEYEGSYFIVENIYRREIDLSKRKFPLDRGENSKGIKNETVIILRKEGSHDRRIS